MDKIQAKLELLRLEKRYTRSRHRRSAFVSNAVYVDGEYVFQTPNSTGSSTTANTTSSGGADALHGDTNCPHPAMGSMPPPLDERDEMSEDDEHDAAQRRRFKRFSSMPAQASPEFDEQPAEQVQRKKLHRFSSIPGFGSSGWDMNKTSRVQERRLSMIR